MGRGHNRLLLYTHDDRAWARAAGTWDPMPWHVEQAYRIAGSDAQHAFWGQANVVSQSLLHQLALRSRDLSAGRPLRTSQAARMNDRKKPAAVANAFQGRPCS